MLRRVCRSLAACQRHTPSSLAAVIGLSHTDVISLRSLRCVRCVGWKPRLNRKLYKTKHNSDLKLFELYIAGRLLGWVKG